MRFSSGEIIKEKTWYITYIVDLIDTNKEESPVRSELYKLAIWDIALDAVLASKEEPALKAAISYSKIFMEKL